MVLTKKKQFIIISDKAEEVANKIMVDPHRGVTLLEAKEPIQKNKSKLSTVLLTIDKL